MHPSQPESHVLPTPHIVSYTARTVRGAGISKNTKAHLQKSEQFMRESNEISYDHTKAMRLDREHTCWPELGGALEASSASQSAPRVPDFRDCRRNSGCRHFPDFYRASARDLAAAGDGDTCWRWSIQACPHGRGGRPILPTPVVAAIKGHPDTFWPFPPRKWLESTAITDRAGS